MDKDVSRWKGLGTDRQNYSKAEVKGVKIQKPGEGTSLYSPVKYVRTF